MEIPIRIPSEEKCKRLLKSWYYFRVRFSTQDGIVCDENGYSMKGVFEVDVAINRYGNESQTALWHGIHEIPKPGKLSAMVS